MLASRKPRRRRALVAPSALLLCAGVLGARLLLASSSSPARRLVEHPTGSESFSLVTLVLGDASCTTAYDGYLAVGVLFALVLYTFLGLAIVCDEYFCESLEQISSALSLSDDVAGATFMAAGSSAPELFTAIITIFVAPGEQGLGTIVGSAVFNLCVIVGVTALCAGQVLQLWWYPLVRDSTVCLRLAAHAGDGISPVVPPALLHRVERGQARRLPVGEVHPRRRDRAAERDFPGGFRALNCARRGFHEGFRHLACQRL